MILRRFYHDGLAQASYLIGCAATGEALVVDPNRDAGQYLDAARAEGLRVTHVTETHIHADFVSGARELAHLSGAALLLSDEGGDAWRYRYGAEEGMLPLTDGSSFRVGNVRIDVLHTPGHTPEHLAFVVTDTAGADRPMGVLTGDFIFVGDVGRPDLLEKAARQEGTMEESARTLFRSLARFRSILPDFVQLWPGHGAGSACGKSLGAVPQSTLGYEKLFNRALAIEDEAEFVRTILEGQPEPPRYFAEMKRINRDGPPLLGGFPSPAGLPAGDLAALLKGGATVVDVRPAAAFAAAHVPGTINIPLNRSFANWSGWLLPYDRDIHLLAPDAATAERATRELAMIGLDRVAGWFGPDALASADGGVAGIAQIDAAELARRRDAGEVHVVDVRARSEWEAGHLPGVPNIPLGDLRERLGEIPADRPLVVHCQSGGRSAIAASIVAASGRGDVANLAGGFQAWAAGGLPVARETERPDPTAPG